jgi:hypothetical protein
MLNLSHLNAHHHMSYTQCQCDSEISTSCLVNFGWYDDIETPCQFASSKTDEFLVTLMWNCYKDCGGSSSPPCEYFNGTWMYSEFDDRQLKKPFNTNAYTFKGDAKTAHHLFVKSSEISGTARVLVSPVYARKP